MNKEKIKIKIYIKKHLKEQLDKYENKDEIINKALELYFNKDFCYKEIERDIILGNEK